MVCLLKLGVITMVGRPLRIVVLAGALAVVAVLVIGCGASSESSESGPSAETLWRAAEELERVYVEHGETTVRDLVEGALAAMALVSPAESEGSVQSSPRITRRLPDLRTENVGPEGLSDLMRGITDVVPDEVPRNFEDVWRAWRALTEAGVDPEKLLVETVRGMVRATGDPAAQVLEGVPATDDDYVAEAYEGIGSLVDTQDDQLVITVPFPGGPAAEAGLRSGDVVVAVDGESVEGLDATEVVARIRGPSGTEVLLTIERPEIGRFDVPVVRAEHEFATVGFRSLGGRIAYLSISRFDSGTPDELARELEILRQQEIEGLVVDLRANPGGSRRAGSAVADQFLDGGIIYHEEALDGTRITHQAEAGGPGVDVPLAVLVDERTRGVAELVAAALRHHRRGPLVGHGTAGNGLLYSSREVGDDLVVVLPSGGWFTPGGRSVQGAGLEPDAVVNVNPDDALIGVDSQIQAGFVFLWTQLNETEAQAGAVAPAPGE